ncbi:peroxiredoxin [Deinococcus multiflagellatus]|uniref:thioredoxin-dependent peroxiredoxin n=1 Tax=Deinococcus multiflagellatus TaxID=1656887 RepID=A0ABW1ZPE3_9DEIO|nr:peroxiredoxin [Deinococcus multiflagellatus]MBZ9714662.1 peroxiredoxin [Deinococcus multiflagellatus]
MTPPLGQPAPTFTRRSDDGREISLEALRGRWVVLYFYPRAGSPGCSIEAQRFEAALPEFERLGAQVIGVSTDTEAKQAAFRDSCALSFPLLPDSDRSLCRTYGVMGGLGGLLGIAGRQTFLIDPQGVLTRHWRVLNPVGHPAEVLRALEELQRPAAPSPGALP